MAHLVAPGWNVIGGGEPEIPGISIGHIGIGAWGLTEANTGSDALRMKCVAKKEGNEWVLNGSKNWITHGISGDIAVVLARTG